MKPTVSEAEVQRACLDYLRLCGAWVIRVNGGAVMVGKRLVRFTDQTGCPDILCCLQGRFVGVECKRPGGKLRPSQGEQIDALRRAGGLAFVADGLDTLRAALRLEGFDVA